MYIIDCKVFNEQSTKLYIRVSHIFLEFKVSVFWVLEDLKFKISEGSDQNWSCPESAQLAVSAKLRQPPGQTQDSFNFGLSLLKF